MARIRSLTAGDQSIRAHETEVDCFYQTTFAADGSTLVHLSTFGSDERASKAKSSQSIQIDQNIAAQLIQVLTQTFPGIRE
jgi:hypothetical protein